MFLTYNLSDPNNTFMNLNNCVRYEIVIFMQIFMQIIPPPITDFPFSFVLILFCDPNTKIIVNI